MWAPASSRQIEPPEDVFTAERSGEWTGACSSLGNRVPLSTLIGKV